MTIMGMLGYILLGLVGVAVLVRLINPRAFSDFFGSINAQVGKAGAAARNADPVAMMEQEIRDAQTNLDSATADLEESEGLALELEEQVKADAKAVALMEAKVRNSLTDDPEDKSGKAAGYVVRLEEAQTTLQKNTEQWKTASTLFENNLEKYRLAKAKIVEAKSRVNSLQVDMKNSETTARLSNLAKKFTIDISGLDNRMSEAEAVAKRMIARNNAVGAVQTALGNDGLEEAREEERLKKAAASLKLEEYRKKMGLSQKA